MDKWAGFDQINADGGRRYLPKPIGKLYLPYSVRYN